MTLSVCIGSYPYTIDRIGVPSRALAEEFQEPFIEVHIPFANLDKPDDFDFPTCKKVALNHGYGMLP